MSALARFVVLLCALFMASTAHASYPVYADGELAPLGAPDSLINSADYLVGSRIVLDQLNPTELELSHGDLYPPGAPDGAINLQDLLLLQQRVLAPSANNYIQNLNLFTDGPATIYVDVDGTTTSTTLVAGGYTTPAATVINDTSFTDPEAPGNTLWRFKVSGGLANIFLGTGDLNSEHYY